MREKKKKVDGIVARMDDIGQGCEGGSCPRTTVSGLGLGRGCEKDSWSALEASIEDSNSTDAFCVGRNKQRGYVWGKMDYEVKVVTVINEEGRLVQGGVDFILPTPARVTERGKHGNGIVMSDGASSISSRLCEARGLSDADGRDVGRKKRRRQENMWG